MWKADEQGINEVQKMRWELVPYMRGRCLDLGCGPTKAFPHFIGVDSCKDTQLFGIPMKPDIKADIEELPMFSSGSFDLVFSSHALEHIEDYHAALREWWRLVKVGGYLGLYLPHRQFYPNIGKREEWAAWEKEHKDLPIGLSIEQFIAPRRQAGITDAGPLYAGTPFGNEDHKWDFLPADIIAAMKANGGGFDLVECQERNGEDEYSFLVVFRKLGGGIKESWKNPKPEKTCAIVRYGAIGDQIQTSSLFPWLKEQGYHITLYAQAGHGLESIQHDPHIDRFIVQEKDAVPPAFLSQFWDYEKKKYDRWINLCESIEGTLLASPGRVQWEWPNSLRAERMNVNYLEWLHKVADVPPPYRPKFYATKEEQSWARKTKESFGKRCVLWSLAGSSGHKVWPHVDSAIAALMLTYPDVHVVLVGDESCQILEAGWQKEPRVHRLSGKWSIRQSMAFAEVADLIIGTETGLLNAAGSMPVPKIVCLSHSSPEMLTKHWQNAIVLQQPEGVGCPKSPCRMLHGGNNTDAWLACPQHEETGTALCQFHISPATMWAAIEFVLGKAVQFQKQEASKGPLMQEVNGD